MKKITLEFTRPDNTTAYAAGDVVAATTAITNVTKAALAPILVTSAGHLLASGDKVSIAGIVGATEANGDWTVTYANSSSFWLVGTEETAITAYTSDGTVTKLQAVTTGAGMINCNARLLGVKLSKDSATVTNSSFRLWLFSDQVGVAPDNSPFTLMYADRTKRIGYVALGACVSGGAGSDAAEYVASAVNLDFSSKAKIYAVLAATAAYVPTAEENFSIELQLEPAV